MKVLVVSSSHDAESKSAKLAKLCADRLTQRSQNTLVDLKDYSLAGNDLHQPESSASYRKLHALVLESDGLVLSSLVYNWGCSAELKRFIEIVGTTPPGGRVQGAFFDKVITFVNAAGLPHSYTAFTGLANSMMLDFKCIVSPYNLYVHGGDWEGPELSASATQRLSKSMDVFLELATLLRNRTYRSTWEL